MFFVVIWEFVWQVDMKGKKIENGKQTDLKKCREERQEIGENGKREEEWRVVDEEEE